MTNDAAVYYAQVGFDRTPENPYNVFRTTETPDSQTVAEVYDRTTRTWVGRQDLIRYTRKSGGGGAVITKAQAEAVIGGWSW